MTFIQLDDGFLGHHKVKRALRAGAQALQMWLALRTYVALNLTDGVIPDEDIDDLPHAPANPRKWLRVLVECGLPRPDRTRGPGLIDQVAGGWALHDYQDHALVRDEIVRRREQAKARKTAWKERRRNAFRDASPDASGTQVERPPIPIPSHPIPDQIRSEERELKNLTGLGDAGPAEPAAPPPPPKSGTRPKHFQAFEDAFASKLPDPYPWPESFAPNDDNREQARVARLDLSEEIAGLRDHAKAKGMTSLDWNAELGKWMRRSVQYRNNDLARKARSGTMAAAPPIDAAPLTPEQRAENQRIATLALRRAERSRSAANGSHR